MSDLVGNPEYRFSHNEAQIRDTCTTDTHRIIGGWLSKMQIQLIKKHSFVDNAVSYYFFLS